MAEAMGNSHGKMKSQHLGIGLNNLLKRNRNPRFAENSFAW